MRLYWGTRAIPARGSRVLKVWDNDENTPQISKNIKNILGQSQNLRILLF